MSPQTHYPEEKPHFKIDAKEFDIGERKKRKRGGGYFPKGPKKGELYEKSNKIREEVMNNPLDDKRIYYIINFIAHPSSNSVSKILEELRVEIINIYPNNSLKVAVERESYEKFAETLDKKRSYIKSITESWSNSIINESIPHTSKLQDVTIEAVNMSGFKSPKEIEISLDRFVKGKGETVTIGYSSDKIILFTGKLSYDSLKDIAKFLGPVERIEKIPETFFDSDQINKNVFTNSNFLSTPLLNNSILPTVCIIDTGINKNHERIKQYVDQILSYSDNQNVDNDDHGHGTGVSGIAIYGGSCENNSNPLSRIVMIKGFNERGQPLDLPIRIIEKAIAKCISKTRVFNLSFSYREPQSSFSRILNQIIYDSDISLIACAGNIEANKILYSLNNNMQYPDYLHQYLIYFPGDVPNAITVGSITPVESTICGRDLPSPFTRTGIGGNCHIKPEVVAYGGNLNLTTDDSDVAIDLSESGIFVPDNRDNRKLVEVAGTSFSAPSIASLISNIYRRYPTINAFLAKALLLSSCSRVSSSNFEINELCQGYGNPNRNFALNSIRWRVNCMCEGIFLRNNNVGHTIRFRFPNGADRVTITVVVGRPSLSNGHLRLEVHKAGNDKYSINKPNRKIGDMNKIISSFKGIFDVKKGGKGEWEIKIMPDFYKSVTNDSLKYGCVITIESTKFTNIMTEINQWIEEKNKIEVVTAEVAS